MSRFSIQSETRTLSLNPQEFPNIHILETRNQTQIFENLKLHTSIRNDTAFSNIELEATGVPAKCSPKSGPDHTLPGATKIAEGAAGVGGGVCGSMYRGLDSSETDLQRVLYRGLHDEERGRGVGLKVGASI